MTVTLVAVAFVLTTLLLAVLMRRLLGVPVGWPRLLLVVIVLNSLGGSLISTITSQMPALDRLEHDPTAPLEAGPVVVVVLLACWVLVLGPVLLVVAEALVPTGSLPDPWTFVRTLPARRRRSRRYARIVRAATRHGLGGYLGVGSGRRSSESASSVGRALRATFEDAGVTFVKLGQMLASRPDVVGDGVARELSDLHADVSAEPWPTTEATLTSALGRPVDEVFASLSHEPLAAASIGQVYRARLHDGTRVVIKVQRAGAERDTLADLDIMRRLARWLTRTTAWARSLDVTGLADGFSGSLIEELDYHVEASNAAAIDESMTAAGGLVSVPRVEHDLSSRRVLVMEEVHGVPVSRASDRLAELGDERREALAQALLASVLHQLLVTGTFHADLHAGNVLLREDDTLTLLDLGSVGRLDSATRAGLARLLLSIRSADAVAGTDALLSVVDRPAGLDDRALERELGALLVRTRSSAGTGLSSVFPDLMSMVVRHGIGVPTQVAATFRALTALEGTLATVAPRLDLVTAVERAGDEMAGSQAGPAAVRETVEQQLAQMLPVLQRLPRRVDALARAAQSGELSMNVRVLAHPDDRAFVTELVSQLMTTAVGGTLAIMGTLFLLTPDGPEIGDRIFLYPTLGATFLLLATVLGTRVMAGVFVRRRS